jgi:hypothetical protein
MIAKVLMAACLVAITVVIHAVGLGVLLSHVFRSTVHPGYTLLANYMVTDSHRVVPGCYSPLRDRRLGAVFLVAEPVYRTPSRHSIFSVLPTLRSVMGTSCCRKSGNCSARSRD